jgi:transmembrane sensor
MDAKAKSDWEQRQVAETQARDWVIRLASGEIAEGELLRFKAWLAAAPGHRVAFEEARRLWQDAAALRPAFAEIRRSAPARRSVLRLAGAAALAACLALVVVNAGNLLTDLRADHRTQVGQQATVSLPDGSRAHLNTDSAIALRFSEQERRVELLRGEVLFEVAPKPARPFRVVAAEGISEALGTSFTVGERYGRVTVRVLSGTVAVASSTTAEASGSAAVVLRKAQQVAYRAGEPPGEMAADDVSTAAAWRDGQIIIDGRSLAEAIEELGRYRPGRIVLLRSGRHDSRVGGVFRLDQVDAAIAALAATQGLTVTRVTDRLLILH